MTDPHYFFGPPQGMAKYDVYSDMEIERLRTMAADWTHAQQQYKKCGECKNYDDRDMMHEHPETGRLICWECIQRMAEERLEEDEGMTRLFDEIGRIQ